MAEKTYRERVDAMGCTWECRNAMTECRDIASEADAEIAALKMQWQASVTEWVAALQSAQRRVAELETVRPSALKEKLRSAEARIAELEAFAADYGLLLSIVGDVVTAGHLSTGDLALFRAALNSKKESK